ncbi:MAG: hypothetical protein A3A43_01960 [Candidatus Liptonbacteria bacterium RIFCSPLOWO2_01_FULL_56_20]|uniref:Metallo-beta-lactamase domain-containing protein n=1 Tax=Candidatus Liptonbacteria bacterium RIFCSPLOWO2_01_FULL_56_20 TaxID=1798652 RepID=A0A1G2CJF2_9BACT|nr:MAG: hypothetical protein A3A43_01960 [Candidatus Liptonbacteria bacterium RIFCSPLOWO2_01_FULL_56_20]
MKKTDNLTIILVAVFAALDIFVWHEVVFAGPDERGALYFLDVGQGDAELLVLPGGVKVLTDAGPDAAISRSLEGVLASTDRYIDLAVISHPQEDHYGGFNDLFRRYRFGAFVVNGRNADPATGGAWDALLEKLTREHIPVITLRGGDRIRYRDSRIDIVSPDDSFVWSGELNDTGLVEHVHTPAWSALLAADIGFNVEDYLVRHVDLRADILKVPHHGSKYSSSEELLRAVRPRLAVIEVGERNRYGHPTEETLARLAASRVRVLRTDRSGTIRVVGEGGKLQVFVDK